MTIIFEAIIAQLGEVGQRMTMLNAAEGAAGNVSVFMRELDDVPVSFTQQTSIELPAPAPALVGGWLVASAASRRLRDIASNPAGTLCLLHLEDDATATLYTASSLRPTSELNSHLLVHDRYVAQHGATFHGVVHAQPPYLTYLSHLLPPDTQAFSRRLLRWQPETIMVFPQGIGVLPFEVPGSQAQAKATAEALGLYCAVVWARHGIVARAEDVRHAADLVEYVEAAAHYEYLNLEAGAPSSGLSDDELRHMCRELGIEQQVF